MNEKDRHKEADKPDNRNASKSIDEENGQRTGENKNLLEWVVFAVSLLLVTGTLGYIGYQMYTSSDGPPEMAVTTRHSPSDSAPNRYHVRLDNRGGSTAESILLEFQLQREDSVLEKAELQLQYLPKASSQEGWIIFSTRPTDSDTVLARIVSFKNPS